MSDLQTEEENTPDPEAILARVIANRGDIFEEFKLIIRAMPRTYELNQQVAGYVHQYRTLGTADQELSLPMRELIATCQLCAKGDDRFAPNHVRKLWRLGVTNAVIFEAALAMATAVGWSTVGHVALAIVTAGDASYADGEIPAGGATVHHCRTIHCGGANVSTVPRRAMTTIFHGPGSARPVLLEKPWLAGGAVWADAR